MARVKPAPAADPAPPDFGARIARLDLKPGEVLVATIDASIARYGENVRDYIAGFLPPGVKLLVLDDRVTLSVVNPEAP